MPTFTPERTGISTDRTLPTPLDRSLEQRMDALGRANEIRSLRATLKRDLKAGRKQLLPLIVDPPEYLETAKIFDLLLALPKIGRVKANTVFNKCRVSPNKTVGGLSQRQRGEIAQFLTSRAWA